MKSSLTTLFIILALSAVSVLAASNDQYIVVLGKDAPASDAVIGANFAASMKATLGVTFTSAIDTDLYAKGDDLGPRTFVVIDGVERKVRIIGTSNAAAAAESYFQRQGFATELQASGELQDLLVDESAVPAEDAQETPAVVLEPVPDEPEEAPPADVAEEADVSADIGLEATAAAPASPDPLPQAQPPAQGVFSRVVLWFKGLF